mmetsp:Transcript_18615/g.46461  ORF Transcript_18615/g.46461 Transcript_18615/m.46461 type:complete len:479 (+) Transcript_18615:358-1794(+)|eukprot:CAMPEP_0178992848 /NCGR_PEP_ID=MMETSP0795-20121207/6352_1 /TAXON_ID=88552 /ORGANISM="Amoebophrya sp., Strain Ameob2" /LENGTH=478 /DNA_ID=CAMNT_0020684795 /DNA_START=282 /DNA_END=1718 /DNA_ORIENTATION=+
MTPGIGASALSSKMTAQLSSSSSSPPQPHPHDDDPARGQRLREQSSGSSLPSSPLDIRDLEEATAEASKLVEAEEQDTAFPWFHMVQWAAENAPASCVFRWDLEKAFFIVRDCVKTPLDFRESLKELKKDREQKKRSWEGAEAREEEDVEDNGMAASGSLDSVEKLDGFSLEDQEYSLVFIEWAEALLTQMAALRRLRFALVPRKMAEETFWHRFFQVVKMRLEKELFYREESEDESASDEEGAAAGGSTCAGRDEPEEDAEQIVQLPRRGLTETTAGEGGVITGAGPASSSTSDTSASARPADSTSSRPPPGVVAATSGSTTAASPTPSPLSSPDIFATARSPLHASAAGFRDAPTGRSSSSTSQANATKMLRLDDDHDDVGRNLNDLHSDEGSGTKGNANDRPGLAGADPPREPHMYSKNPGDQAPRPLQLPDQMRMRDAGGSSEFVLSTGFQTGFGAEDQTPVGPAPYMRQPWII